jgi:hypothetical protein
VVDKATAPEKKGPRHNPQHDGWPIRWFVPSFTPEPAIEVVGVKPPYVDSRLLGSPSQYHRHAIGTFNTCSWGPTHRSLTDIGGGYNLEGANFLHTIPRPSQLAVSTFHLRVLPSLQFNHFLPEIPKLSLRTLWPSHGLLTTRPSTVTYIDA